MSVSDNYLPTKTVGDGVTVLFTASWNVIASTYIRVFLENISTGVQVAQVLDTDFSLTFDSSGLTVDFTIDAAPPPNTENVIISRNVALDQTDPYKTSQGFQGSVIENSFDKITSMNQDIQDEVTRSLKYPVASGKTGTIPTPIDDTVLVFDGTTGALKTGATNTALIAGATNADASATAAAASASAASTSETNAAASAAAAAVSAATISALVNVITSTSNAITVDLDDGSIFQHIMTEDTTFTFSNPVSSGSLSSFKLFMDNAAGAYTPTWPASVVWSNGTEPDLTTANEKNVLVFDTIDGGTIWYGALAAEAVA